MQVIQDRIRHTFGVHAVTKPLLAHQHDGVQQLVALLDRGCGALLADIMGLGKTLQCVLAVVGHVSHVGVVHTTTPLPILVVAPPSAHPEWQATLGSLLPGSALFRYVLTTPHVNKLEALAGAGNPFSAMVIDEAHQVLGMAKDTSKTWKALVRVRALVKHGVLLATGTPLNAANPCKSLAAIVSLLPDTRDAVAQSVVGVAEDPSTETFWWKLLRASDTHAVDAAAARLWARILVRRTHEDLRAGVGAPALLPPQVPLAQTLAVEVDGEAARRYGVTCRRLTETLEKVIPMMNNRERMRSDVESQHRLKKLLHKTFALLHAAQAALMWAGDAWGEGVEGTGKYDRVAGDADADGDGDEDGNQDGGEGGKQPLSSYLDRVLRCVLDDVLVDAVGAFVTCFWIEPLDQLHCRLAETLGADAVAFVQGKDSVAKRASVVKGVKEGRIKVVLMTSGCAVGLTLIELKRVYVVGVALDMSKEKQAIGRVAGRVGQTADVRVIHVVPVLPVSSATTLVHEIRKCHEARDTRDKNLMMPHAVSDDDGHKAALLINLHKFLLKPPPTPILSK